MAYAASTVLAEKEESGGDLRIPSTLITAQTSAPLPSGALAVLWRLTHALNAPQGRLALEETLGVGTWLTMAAKSLKPPGQRHNRWLFRCLRALMRCELSGDRDGEPWRAVLVSECRAVRGGTEIQILLTPSGVEMLRYQGTYAKIEKSIIDTMGRSRHAHQLYALLADRRRMRQRHWTFSLAELRTAMNLSHQAQYKDWSRLKDKVLIPAVEKINAFGHVSVRMTPEKSGRYVTAVRFDWEWEGLTESDTPEQAASSARLVSSAGEHEERDKPTPERVLSWWTKIARRTRRTMALRLGYRSGEADLSDTSPIAADAWDMMTRFAEKQRRDKEAEEEREAAALSDAEREFDRLLDAPTPAAAQQVSADSAPAPERAAGALADSEPASLFTLPFSSPPGAIAAANAAPAEGEPLPASAEPPPPKAEKDADGEDDQIAWFASLARGGSPPPPP